MPAGHQKCIVEEPKATHGLPSLSQGFLLFEQAAIRLFLAWYRLGKSSEASGTRGTERPFYAVERSRLSPKAGAGKRDSFYLSFASLE